MSSLSSMVLIAIPTHRKGMLMIYENGEYGNVFFVQWEFRHSWNWIGAQLHFEHFVG